ncbi:H(+)/Cl(-) exchange transporter ClcA [mine drainage metagenome]|uniref:H(+)/Cl(-) exchange transporter ClcA n=1 Tax=mine drainage metagenome TaxID=410659 RepID=A0A1J5SAZ0_9ZZZZ
MKPTSSTHSASTAKLPPWDETDAAGAPLRRLTMLSVLAGALGAFVGAVAYVLFRLIGLITNLAFYGRWSFSESVPTTVHLHAWVILIPAIGGLVVGLMARFGSRKICGHGIDAVIESVLYNRSKIDPEIAVLKPASSAVVIGTGGPFGVEGPIIQTGGAVGSVIGQVLHLTVSERKTLLAAGAAAGLAATFSTPIAAVLLAIELILFEYKPRSFIPLVIATTLATSVRFMLLGRAPMVALDPVAFGFVHELPWYLLLGVIAGLAAVGFVRALEWSEDAFELLHKVGLDEMWWPALGGLGLGVIGYLVPQTLGSGYGIIADILNGRLAVLAVALILVFKPMAILTALGSRTSGGTLAPMFMSGAALGSIFAFAVNALVPAAALSPAACAILCMAAFFGAAARAPFTFILFAFEMTRSYNAVLPLMLVVVVANGVALALMKHSVMTLSLARKGLPVNQEYEADAFKQISVGLVMDEEALSIPASTLVADLSERIANGEPGLLRHPAFPLVDDDHKLVGIVTRADLVKAFDKDPSGQSSVLDAGTRDPEVAFPDEPVDEALNRMLKRGCGRLPVVSRDDPRRLVGYLGRTAVLNARLHRLHEDHVVERGWLARLRSSDTPHG